MKYSDLINGFIILSAALNIYSIKKGSANKYRFYQAVLLGCLALINLLSITGVINL